MVWPFPGALVVLKRRGVRVLLTLIIKRRTRFHESALKASTICIVLVVVGIILFFLPHCVSPNPGKSFANGKL
jgi:uncharacterized membrane protein